MKKAKTIHELFDEGGLEEKSAKNIIRLLRELSPRSSLYRAAKRFFNEVRDACLTKQLMMAELAKLGFQFRPPRKGEKYSCTKLVDRV